MTCTNCGKELADGVLFCDACGAKLLQEEQPVVAPVEEPIFPEQEAAPEQPRKSNKALVAILAAVLAVVALGAAAYFLFFNKKAPTAPILYLKDGEMWIGGKGEPWQVTDDLGTLAVEHLYPVLAPDGKTLFYLDKIEDGGTVYYRNIKSEDSEAFKLESDIAPSALKISKDSKSVAYIKEDNLYRHDLDERTKIDSEVAAIKSYTPDLKRIIYTTKEEVKDDKGNKTTTYNLKIDIDGEQQDLVTEIGDYIQANEKLTEFYFTKDGALYMQPVDGEKDKIADDVIFYTVHIYESGEMYFVVQHEEKAKAEENTDNDAAEEETEAEARASTNGPTTATKTTYELCYYDGADVISIAKDLETIPMRAHAAEKPVLIYSIFEEKKEKDKDGNDTNVTVYTTYLVAEGGEGEELDFASKETNAHHCYLNAKGTKVYYADNFNIDEENREKNTCDIFVMGISNGVAEEAEEFDTGVSTEQIPEYYLSEDTVVYAKNLKNGKFELFVNGEMVADDVTYYDYQSDANILIYKTDKTKKGTYTLNVWNGKEGIEVADGVETYEYQGNGKIAYLANCSEKTGKGELYEYTKGEPEQIDEDVLYIIPCIVRYYK